MKARAAETSVLLAIGAGAAFSFYQLGSGLFACGKDIAGAETRYWLAFAAAQGALFMGAALSERLQRAYRILQYLTLPLLAVPVGQLALAYPRTAVWLCLLGLGYQLAVALPSWMKSGVGGARLPVPATAIPETAVFVMATIAIHSSVAFLVMHSPGMRLDDRLFLVIAAVAAATAGWLVRGEPRLPPLSIAQVPPLGLLLVILMRAKLPDGAYDSLFYKATLPIMMADWRTAITGAFDHALLGTNLSEIVNAQFRILDPSYPPALISSLAFVALWAVIPLAASSILAPATGSGLPLARNAFALLGVSLTEALVGAGTAYHEPLMALLLAAALLPIPLAWVFVGAAIATKATIIFVLPLVALAKWASLDCSRGIVNAVLAQSRPLVLVACLALGALVAGEQFHRNYAYTGRVTGLTEALSGLTDPANRVLAKARIDPAQVEHGGKIGATFVHVLTLDRWIKPSEFGFHVIPSSRLPAIAAVLLGVMLLSASLRRERLVVGYFAAWALCSWIFLHFAWQGRYLLPISFAAALGIALLAGRMQRRALESGHRPLAIATAGVVAAVAIGDQLVGSLINNGWDCRRNLLQAVEKTNSDFPVTALERRLAGLASGYRSSTVALDVIPSIACENSVDRMRYLGVHYVYAYPSTELTTRRVAAQPELADSLARSTLAVCFTSQHYADSFVPAAARGDFVEVEGVATDHAGLVRILVSKPLTSGLGPRSLAWHQVDPFSWLGLRQSPTDLMPLWDAQRLTSSAPADAPGGKGALVTYSGSERVGVLISPFALAFDVDFEPGSKWMAEFAMPYSNSDGMGVEFLLEAGAAVASVPVAVGPKPAASPGPAWQAREIAVPAHVKGRGTLIVRATSPSGDSSADWIYFRKLRLERASR